MCEGEMSSSDQCSFVANLDPLKPERTTYLAHFGATILLAGLAILGSTKKKTNKFKTICVSMNMKQNKTNQNKNNIHKSMFVFWMLNKWLFVLFGTKSRTNSMMLAWWNFGFVHETSIHRFWNFDVIGFIAICRITSASNSMSIQKNCNSMAYTFIWMEPPTTTTTTTAVVKKKTRAFHATAIDCM